MEPNWDALYLLWQVIVGLAAAGAFGVAIHTRRNAQHGKLAERVSLLERSVGDTPSTKALHDLELSIERLSGDLRTTNEKLEGLQGWNRRLDRVTERMERFLIDRSGE